MPTIPVYLKHHVYWRLVKEADKLDVGIGKFCSMILEEYCKFLEKKEVENGRKEI